MIRVKSSWNFLERINLFTMSRVSWIHKIVKLRISFVSSRNESKRKNARKWWQTESQEPFLYVVIVLLMNADNAPRKCWWWGLKLWNARLTIRTHSFTVTRRTEDRLCWIEERRCKKKLRALKKMTTVESGAASVYAIKALFYANVWWWEKIVFLIILLCSQKYSCSRLFTLACLHPLSFSMWMK